MAEGTYEFECMRAELLGIEKPDYEEFLKRQPENIEVQDEEEAEEEILREAEGTTESTKRISGGLDELNSILQQTQKKIHRFKASCGSLTNLLKIKIGHGSSTDSLEPNGATDCPETPPAQLAAANGAPKIDNAQENGASSGESARKSDLTRALDNHVDAFDSLIDKAERAQLSMSHQNREMKKFLK